MIEISPFVVRIRNIRIQSKAIHTIGYLPKSPKSEVSVRTFFLTYALLPDALDEVTHGRGPRRREKTVDDSEVVLIGLDGKSTRL